MSTDVVCMKQQASSAEDDQGEIHAVSGEWTNEVPGSQRAGSRKFLTSSGDIFKHSIRRSWTINGPPRWYAVRGSPGWRAYQSLPSTARHQDYFQDSSDLIVPPCTGKPNKTNDAINAELDVSETNEEAPIDKDESDSETTVKQSLHYETQDNSIAADTVSNEETDRSKRPAADITKPKQIGLSTPTENAKVKSSAETFSPQEQNTPRVSLIKPPRIHTKFFLPDIKQSVKTSERKSNIPIFRRSSKEFEDIRSPQESAKRSLIPQRYKGSTDDLRRSREDINVPSLIPKLLSPRHKDDRSKRSDSRDEIRYGLKAYRKDNKELKEDLKESKSGIKVLRRNSKEDVNKDSDTSKLRTVNKEEKYEKVDESTGEESRLKSSASEHFKFGKKLAWRKDNKESNDGTISENKIKIPSGNDKDNEKAVTEEMMMVKKKKLATTLKPTNELMKRERKCEEPKWDESRTGEDAEEIGKDSESLKTANARVNKDLHDEDIDESSTSATDEKEVRFETNCRNHLEDFQVVRRKFSKEEFSNPDETDDIPNRRCSSHLSPEESPLSTRSSRYSPRESESEPTPALPRKAGDYFAPSQRVREAITRTRRESNSSAKYESSGSESIRLSEPGVHRCLETRRVRFCGGGVGGAGIGIGVDETIQRDSATSAGEDEPLHNTPGRDPRVAPGPQGRTVVRRRRQFDTQGSRRRGRTLHVVRACGDDLQTLQLIGRGGGPSSPPAGPLSQGQDTPITDYRRLVFISSDSSSGREEDDADSSSGSSSLNGASRCGLAQGLEDCDWDYFESGSIPLSHHVNVGTNPSGNATVNSGISLPAQHWSCCPGRGSSACQACGGARAANVLPVPVPIPVPVPYPVPVPAALWTNDFTNSSMINCGTGAEGALRLRGGPVGPLHPAASAVPWFAWPPRFTHAVHGVRADRLNLNLKANADVFDPATFAFHAGVIAGDRFSGIDFGQDNTKASSAASEPSISNNSSHANSRSSKTGANETTYAFNVDPRHEVLFHNDPSASADFTSVEAATAATAANFNIDPNTEKSASRDDATGRKKGVSKKNNSETESLTADVDDRSGLKPLHSSKCRNKVQKMYRLSQGDSGSSSGRSSADSSDLEDSASHRFSRVFVVNDDSLTSENDAEGNEDSDSASEGGITLTRVTALPEDGPVILQHVKLLDEDTMLMKSEMDHSESSDSDSELQGVVNKKYERNLLGDSRVMVADSPRSDSTFKSTDRDDKFRPKDGNKLKRFKSFDPDVNEIYLVDSKVDSDEQIKLKSIKNFDPDVFESPTLVDRRNPSETQQLDGSTKHTSTQPEISKITSEFLDNVQSQNLHSSEIKESLMPERTESFTIALPDSLQDNESKTQTRANSESFGSDLTVGESNSNKIKEIAVSSDLCSKENKFDPPVINIDKPVTRVDKPAALSAVNDEPSTAAGFEASINPASHINTSFDSTMNLTTDSDISTTTTGSSETNTGSEVSSDELHEYEVSSPVQRIPLQGEKDRQVAFSAINNELISSRDFERDNAIFASLADVQEESDRSSSSEIQFPEESEDSTLPCGGGLPQTDSGVTTGVENTSTTIRGVVEIPPERHKGKSILVLASEIPSDAVGQKNAQLTEINNGLIKSGDVISGDETQSSAAARAEITEKIKPISAPVNLDFPRSLSGNKIETSGNEVESSHDNNNIADFQNGHSNDTFEPLTVEDNNDSKIFNSHSVDDIISSKIHEIFKSVDDGDKIENTQCTNEEQRVRTVDETSSSAHDENLAVRGERSELKQVEGDKGSGETERGTTLRSQSVHRRPPIGKEEDGFPFGFVNDPLKDSENFTANKYKSLVMITQGTYQPVSVVTSDTTTLLQPEEEGRPPQGLAGYFQLALEAVAEPHQRNGPSPRRPLMVKRPAQAQTVIAAAEPEVDSGLSVGGSASESDDVQSVKSASKSVSSLDQSLYNVEQCSQKGSSQGPSYSNDCASAAAAGANPGVVILEEGLADDDSWVEEVSHDEDEQGATTATEESSEDEANNLGDREEELRGYHRQAIDFTLHTIVEESCEESEAEPSLSAASPRRQRPPSASELEKYFFFGLGDGNVNICSREIDSLSETSSIYSEGLESLGQEETTADGDKNSGDFLNSSRLEKYFLSEFLGFNQDRRDSDGSVGSDSEGRPSPEQRRKRLVRARGTGRSHSSSLDNLLALAQSSQNLSSQSSLQDLSMNNLDSQETQSEGSSTETDGAEDQTPAFGTDGQFDTVKRKKKKPRNLGTQSPRIPEDRNKTPEPVVETDGESEAINLEDDRAKTPQPAECISNQSDANRGKQPQGDGHSVRGKQQADSERGNQVNEMVNANRTKQQSRDSGFIGSCDDLLQHQKVSNNEGQSSNGNHASGKDTLHDREAVVNKNEEIILKAEVPSAQSSLAPPPNASLSRKDSFNNWSSDEETNLMMSKMRQFFKTMVGNSNNNQNSSNNNSSGASPAPSPRMSTSSPKSRLGSHNRMKPPQLVYFENELTRLMKTVPGIRDEQVREIVEYLSSEDTWSDSYDSSDYTSSDLEGAGGRRSALQEQISQSCQQIISKFDTTASDVLSEKESTAQPAQPLNRDTAVVYQKLVQSFTKMAGDGVSSDASSTPHSSPPLIAKVMHHIGSRLVALMHEVSEGGPAVQLPSWRRYPHHRTPSSASTTEEDDDSTSDSANTPSVQHQQPLPRSKSHDPLLLLNSHHAAGCQEGEEREASDYERFSWRGSFESALMAADSRTKLSLLAYSGDVSASASALQAIAAKRRSAGDLLFNPKSLSREQLDRVRSCGSIGGGSGSIEDKIWSNRRRSSVPDASTRGESGASAGDEDTEDELEYSGDSRATTLPRGLQAAASAATNSLPRLPAAVPTSQGVPMMMHKAHSVHHFLQQHNNVKSARYRPPGFARNNSNCSGGGSGVGGPKRAVSAPGLQIPASSSSGGKRDPCRTRRQQAISLTPDDGSILSEACSTPIIGGGVRGIRGGSLANDDDMDHHTLHSNSHMGTRASLSSLGARSDSMASVYSGAGEGRWCGSVAVRGEVEFALQYDYKQSTFEVRVTQCRDLAPVDVKRNRSDPYVKVYLLPDKSKSGKRKTKVKKHTLNPVFDETLKFHMSVNGLETRTLWLTVWHSDMFGRNDFLGEVRMNLENKIYDDPTPRWYPLQERTEPFDDPVAYKGEVIVGLKFVPPDPGQQPLERDWERDPAAEQRDSTKTRTRARKSWNRGALHVLVKGARNLQTRAKHSGTCDPFCKSYLLPDKGRSGKQKTGVVRRCSGGTPIWNHTFIYKDVNLQELAERGLELTVWDHDRIASNEFLGGVRFNLGTGKHYGKPVEWMDATGRELSLWQSMLERPNFWVEGSVTLRPNLHNHNRNNAN